MFGNKRANSEAIIPETSNQTGSILTFVIDHQFGFVSYDCPCPKQAIKEIRVFGRFAGRARAKPLIESSYQKKPISSYGEVSAASYMPRQCPSLERHPPLTNANGDGKFACLKGKWLDASRDAVRCWIRNQHLFNVR
jgi:hypothetical protein